MLRSYNYSTRLSQIFSFQLEDKEECANELGATTPLGGDGSSRNDLRCISNLSSNNNKSFTIAAILGLQNEKISQDIVNSSSDLSVVNLSARSRVLDGSRIPTCDRLQLPMGQSSASIGMTSCYANDHPRHSVRGMKHIMPSDLQKKNSKSKRVRTIFTPEQLERLEAEFERQQYMVGPERLYLAHTLQLTEAQVKVWFQNRRIKWRKHHLEITQQRLAVLKQQLLIDDAQLDVQDTSSSNTET